MIRPQTIWVSMITLCKAFQQGEGANKFTLYQLYATDSNSKTSIKV